MITDINDYYSLDGAKSMLKNSFCDLLCCCDVNTALCVLVDVVSESVGVETDRNFNAVDVRYSDKILFGSRFEIFVPDRVHEFK